jgi:hypothetical protein
MGWGFSLAKQEFEVAARLETAVGEVDLDGDPVKAEAAVGQWILLKKKEVWGGERSQRRRRIAVGLLTNDGEAGADLGNGGQCGLDSGYR